MRSLVRFLLLAIAVAALVFPEVASAATSIVTFPDLPDGATWISGLTTIFVSAAGLGLGIVGLRMVIRMIRAGVAKK